MIYKSSRYFQFASIHAAHASAPRGVSDKEAEAVSI